MFSRHSQVLLSLVVLIVGLSCFDCGSSLFLSNGVYEVAIPLFYVNLDCLMIPEGKEPVLRSFILDKALEFSSRDDILNLPDEGEHVFLLATVKFTLLSKLSLKFLTKF